MTQIICGNPDMYCQHMHPNRNCLYDKPCRYAVEASLKNIMIKLLELEKLLVVDKV